MRLTAENAEGAEKILIRSAKDAKGTKKIILSRRRMQTDADVKLPLD